MHTQRADEMKAKKKPSKPPSKWYKYSVLPIWAPICSPHSTLHINYTTMSEGSKPDVFHSDDINSEYLDDQLPGKPVAGSSKGLLLRQQPQHNTSADSDAQYIEEIYRTNSYVAPASGLERAATNNERHQVHRYNALQKFRYAFREPLAEFLGTMILVMFGDGVVAQTKLSGGASGNYTTIAFSWATAVFLGYAASAGISGAHLNPGVTLSAAVFRQFPWRKVPGYIFGQFFGGYIGALIMYAVYQPAINEFEGYGIRTVTGDTATAGIFCTFAQPFLETRGQVASELVASALLQLGIFSMTDPHNAPLGNSFPFGLFVLIYGVGSSYGYLTGYAINLARDFGPRLAASTVGYPREMFTYGHHYFWVPLVIPIIGCLLGAFIYDLFVYQGLDSPLNQPDFGFGQSVKKMQSFQMKDLKPDFDIHAYHSKRAQAEENENV